MCPGVSVTGTARCTPRHSPPPDARAWPRKKHRQTPDTHTATHLRLAVRCQLSVEAPSLGHPAARPLIHKHVAGALVGAGEPLRAGRAKAGRDMSIQGIKLRDLQAGQPSQCALQLQHSRGGRARPHHPPGRAARPGSPSRAASAPLTHLYGLQHRGVCQPKALQAPLGAQRAALDK